MTELERLFPARLALAPIVAVILLALFPDHVGPAHPDRTGFVGRSASAVTYTVVDLATLEQGSTVVVRGPNAAGTLSVAAESPATPRTALHARRPGRDHWAEWQ